MHVNESDKAKLYSLFNNLTPEDKTSGLSNTNTSDVLIIDALNTFIRGWTASPALNENGDHTGGISSFLRSIGYAIKLLKPSRVIVVFDGKGGSAKRRKIYPGYKNGRKNKLRINRAYGNLLPADDKSFDIELLRTVLYLDTLPVTTMSIDNIEADDTIAYLAMDTFSDSNVSIMSTDKDFLQLASERINIWSPTKKKIYGCREIHDEFGVSCMNFIMYKVLNGDASDNIDGVKGAGIKTIIRSFPFLAEDVEYGLNEIYNYSENHRSKYKIYENVLESKSILERNFELMQLKETHIQSFTQLRIEEIIKKKTPLLNRLEFSKLITEDCMWNNIPQYQVWLGECFNKLSVLS
jgi:5'-3' exonuclease